MIRFGKTLFAFSLVFVCTVFTVVLFGTASLGVAQEVWPAGLTRQVVSQVGVARELTHSFLDMAGQYRHANRNEQLEIGRSLRQIAELRRRLLTALIETAPGQVLEQAIPADVRQSLPADIQSNVEEQVELEGTLEIMYEDYDTSSRLLRSVKSGKYTYRLNFADEPASELETGAKVRVKGVRVGEVLALTNDNMTSAVNALAAIAPKTFGEQKTLVILVNFQDNQTQPYTTAYAANVVFGTTSDFYRENSQQQTWLTGDVSGWYTIPMNSTICDTSSLANYAKQAASAAGVNLSAYTRYVYGFPSNACSWWGLGSVGGSPSQAWIKGSFTLKVVGHEMGHNLGLYHSQSWDCGSLAVGTSCTASEYGDTLDIMGNPSSGHFNAFQKERIGWLDYGISQPITTVQATGDYWLEAYESAGTNPKALKILKSTDPTTGKRTWYYVEYRKGIGFDSSFYSNANVMNGVVIHTGSETSGNSSYLLDMTPETSSWSDPALAVGSSFNDPNGAVTITPLSAGSTAATVNVSFAPLPCVQASPAITIMPPSISSVLPGAAMNFTVTVANKGSAGCAAASFGLQATGPAGWTATFGSASLGISPGASASTSLAVTSPATASDGTYTVAVTATNMTSGMSSQSSVSVTVASSLTVTVTTDRSAYSSNQMVVLSAKLSTGGKAVAGAAVSFAIAKPNGSKVTGTATTGADGSAVYKYRLNKKQDPAGNYQVTASAGQNGLTGQGTTVFAVN